MAYHLSGTFDDAALFVDFGMLSEPDLTAPGIASMRDLSVDSDDARSSLIAYLP